MDIDQNSMVGSPYRHSVRECQTALLLLLVPQTLTPQRALCLIDHHGCEHLQDDAKFFVVY